MVRIGDYAQRHDRAAGATSNHAGGHSQTLRGTALSRAARHIRLRVLPGILGGALLTASAGAAAQTTDASAPAAPVNAFHDQAAQLGVRKCASLFATLGQSATNGSTYAVQVRANRTAPDAHAVIGVAGSAYDTPQYSGQAAAIALAAPAGQGCDGQMVRVAPFQQPCPEVVRQLPAGSVVAATLSGVPLYDLGGDQGQALLLANGDGCVVVTVALAAAPG